MKRTTQYYTEEFHKALKTVSSLEELSMSELTMRELWPYLNLHLPGNPQQTLPRILATGKPYVASGQCVYCVRPSVTTGVWKDGKSYRLCDVHAKMYRRDKRWKIE